MLKTYTSEAILFKLECLWEVKVRPNWLALEEIIDMIHHSDLTAEQRNLATMEALDAVTRRGHFDPKNYLTTNM